VVRPIAARASEYLVSEESAMDSTVGWPGSMNRQRLAGSVVGFSIGAATLADRWILVLLVVIVFVVVCGVIFPAVWSKKPTRRRDACVVLEILWTRKQGELRS